MFYPDYKLRYMILGAKEIATATDNKTGVYALMDKINFSREKYRLGHTKVFFRAGALAALEEVSILSTSYEQLLIAQIPKAQKTDNLTVFFALSGSVCTKLLVIR